MKYSRHSLAALALALGSLVPRALAQKPPAPTPTPPANPTQPAAPVGPQPTQPIGQDDLVLFLSGHIATSDGTSLPNDVLVERICDNEVRQQVYAASQGDFSMQLGLNFAPLVDATAGGGSQEGVQNKASLGGIPRRDLFNCMVRASAAGFRSNSISLVELTPSARTIDVGAIVVERTTKIKGMTLNATAYKAPPNARKAYENGLEAESKGKPDQARRYFEQALKIYPRYASAWFQLGKLLEKENQKDAARAAYTRAASLDTRFPSPYLSLAAMAYREENWTEVVQFTSRIIDADLLNYGGLSGYVLDLDELNPAEAYFYNAAANYKLEKIPEAEKSALKGEHVDLRDDFPQLHLLLANIFARKKDYAAAVLELQTYLELNPHTKDGDQIRERLAKLQELNRSALTQEKPAPN